MRGDREDRGWRECERGQRGQGMEGVWEGTGDGGSERGDREDRGWRKGWDREDRGWRE